MSRFAPAASVCLALGLLATSPDAQEAAYEAGCTELSGNLRSDERICEGFRFTDGVNEIVGGLAEMTRFEFDDNLVRITDGVRLSFGTTEVLADNAVLRFADDELVHGELTGSPVEMSDFIEERDATLGGTAESITYDKLAGTLSLNGQSTLVVDENAFMGCDWIYNFVDQTYEAGSSEDCSGVQFRLTPPPEEDGNAEVRPEPQ